VAELVAGDPDPGGLLSARQAPRDPRAPLLGQQRAAREGLLGPEVVQVPEQVVIDGGAHSDEPFAVVDEQPNLEFDARRLRDRQPLKALPERCAGDGDRVDAVGLATITPGAALAGHQPGGDANDPLAAGHQQPLEAARDMPAVLQRPHALGAQAASPRQR
jgi:hypothetical protein